MPSRTRRPIALLSAALLTLPAVLAGCGGGGGGGGDAGGPTEITVWHGYTDAQADAITAQAKEWNTAHPKATVKLVFNGGNDFALEKTVAGFTAGNFPDVSYQYGSSLAQLARQPKLVDLTERVKAPDAKWDDFFPAEREAGTVDGKVVGVPALVDNLALVYNKALFQAAGIPEPTADWSWEDFRAAAKQLTNPATKTFGWAYVNDGSEDTVWRWLAMLWQAGGSLLSEDGRKPAFDSAAGKAALQQLQDLAVTDRSVYLDGGNQNYLNLFNGGKIAMLWTGPWDLSSINSDVDYGVTVLPGYNGDHQTIAGPDLYLLFDHSDARTDTAWQFVQWLTSAEVHLRYAIQTGDLPLRKSETQLPDYQKFLAKYPGNAVFVQNLDNVKQARPNLAAYPEISTAIGQMVQSVLLGQAQPADALKSAEQQVTGVLAGS